ncbi:hypothetical protein D9758_006536 [Tetrapyrgos nigripes]|uniref:DDE-1 domain-containing protein n=1 Tax=Tetrapyrgos nigripes TaxID=182062 RepID=A0A8H5GKW1_9AGAR|nr:hypothetical protein D9758_006536 [Tetrapyrgos nigripes]
MSENGWTDQELCKEWIEKIFEPATQEKANREAHTLFMDGHSSHFTPEIIEFAMRWNISIIGYPPHCTHALQGLDVVCFAKMKHELKLEINTFKETYKRPVGKAEIMGVFGRAFIRAFTLETAKAAFRATGIHPFDQTVITPEQMKPAEATSIRSSFAMTQTSPVKAIIESFCTYRPTTFDLSPSHA